MMEDVILIRYNFIYYNSSFKYYYLWNINYYRILFEELIRKYEEYYSLMIKNNKIKLFMKINKQLIFLMFRHFSF